MNGLLKAALIGGGAYLLYEWYTGGFTGISMPATDGSSTVAVPVSVAPNMPVRTALSNVSLTSLANAAQAAGYASVVSGNIVAQNLTSSQWGYLVNKLSGLPVPDLQNYLPSGSDGSQTYPISVYYSALMQWGNNNGLSGGLGAIIDLANLFKGVRLGSGFGAREFGLGDLVSDPMMSAAYIDQGPFLEAATFNGSKDGTTDAFLLAASRS